METWSLHSIWKIRKKVITLFLELCLRSTYLNHISENYNVDIHKDKIRNIQTGRQKRFLSRAIAYKLPLTVPSQYFGFSFTFVSFVLFVLVFCSLISYLFLRCWGGLRIVFCDCGLFLVFPYFWYRSICEGTRKCLNYEAERSWSTKKKEIRGTNNGKK